MLVHQRFHVGGYRAGVLYWELTLIETRSKQL